MATDVGDEPMLIPRSFCIVLAIIPAFGMFAFAQTPQSSPPAPGSAPAMLRALFTVKNVDGSLFASSFTAKIPTATVQTVVDGFRTRLGAFGSVEPAGTDFAISFERGSVLATIALDASGKIAGLLLHDEISPAVRAALERFLGAKTISADWFSATFLAQIPIAHVQSLVDQVRADEGPFVRLDERDHRYVVVFEKAANPIFGSLDDAGRFVALRIGPPLS